MVVRRRVFWWKGFDYKKRVEEARWYRQREMGSVGNVWFHSVQKVPLDTQLQNKSLCGYIVPPYLNYPMRLTPISCELSERGIQDNSSTKSKSFYKNKNKNRMEDYNMAMKRMMRNPYEYHHDLGQFHLFIVFFAHFALWDATHVSCHYGIGKCNGSVGGINDLAAGFFLPTVAVLLMVLD